MKYFIISVYLIHGSHSVNRMKDSSFHVFFREIIKNRSKFSYVVDGSHFFLSFFFFFFFKDGWNGLSHEAFRIVSRRDYA